MTVDGNSTLSEAELSALKAREAKRREEAAKEQPAAEDHIIRFLRAFEASK